MGFWNDLKNAAPNKVRARGRELYAAEISSIQKGDGLSSSELEEIGFKKCEVCNITFGATFSGRFFPCLIIVSEFDHLSFGEHLPAVFACNMCVKTFKLDIAWKRSEAKAEQAAERKAAERKAAERKAAERKAAERKAAERKAAERKAAERKARLKSENHTGDKSGKTSKTGSKISDPLILQCQNCNQLLNVPKGTKWKVSCPTCGNSWVHDGTYGKAESSYPSKDQVVEKVNKYDAEQVTHFAKKPKSKLQLREEHARQVLEKEAYKTNPDDLTPLPTDVDYAEEVSADAVRILNEEKRIAEEKNRAWAEHEIERGREDRGALQRVRKMHSDKASTNIDVDGKEHITSNGASFREQHKATLERREKRLADEKRKKEEELQAEDNRKAERKRKDREDRLKLREKTHRDAAVEKTVQRPETTYKRLPIHGALSLPVRRHINWNTWRPDLREDLAHLVQDIKRRVCGIASAAAPWFSV